MLVRVSDKTKSVLSPIWRSSYISQITKSNKCSRILKDS